MVADQHTSNRDVEADRLSVALHRLVADARLTDAQAETIRAEFAAVKPAPDRQPWMAVLPEVGGYVGGTFLMAAAWCSPSPGGTTSATTAKSPPWAPPRSFHQRRTGSGVVDAQRVGRYLPARVWAPGDDSSRCC
jgi:hypothetical protein